VARFLVGLGRSCCRARVAKAAGGKNAWASFGVDYEAFRNRTWL